MQKKYIRYIWFITLGVLLHTASMSGQISGPLEACAGSTQLYTAPEGTNYIWNTSGGTGNSTSRTILVTWDEIAIVGSVSVSYEDEEAELRDLSITVNVHAIPEKPTLTMSGTICNGSGEIVLTANSSTSGIYQWYKNGELLGEGYNSPTLTRTITDLGIYTVTVTKNNCISEKSDPKEITNIIASKPSIIIASPVSGTICNSGEISLTANGSGVYAWYKNDVLVEGNATSAFMETLSQPGTYQYSVKSNVDGCLSEASSDAVITVKNNIIVSPTDLQTTVGERIDVPISISNVNVADILHFNVTTGSLPNGVTLNDGRLTGIPTKIGTYAGNITVSNEQYCSGTGTYSIKITCSLIDFPETELFDGIYNTSYTREIAPAITNEHVSLVYKLEGPLPEDLDFDENNLTVYGIPEEVGLFPFMITATDANNPTCFANQSYSIEVKCGTITLSDLSTTEAALESVYTSAPLNALDGKAPYTYAINNAPDWLSLTANNRLTGTPHIKTGAYAVTINASDVFGCSNTREYTITVGCGSISFPATTLAAGKVGKPYNSIISAATRGSGTYEFTYEVDPSTSLPAGLQFNPMTRTISGTPTSKYAPEFRIISTDVNNPECTQFQTYTINIECGDIALSAINTSANYGNNYSEIITTTGGVAPYTYVLKSGTLPQGLSLNSTGRISGTPTGSGATYFSNFTITTTDSQGCSGENAYTIIVGCTSGAISPSVIADGQYGVAYNQQFTIAPSTTNDRYSLVGTIPGLSLSSSGELKGTPQQAGTFSIGVSVIDANQCSSSQTYTLDIKKAEVTVEPDANQSKKYNESIPTLTYQLLGVIFSTDATSLRQVITLATDATKSSPVGEYNIILPENTSHPNYNIKLTNTPNKFSVVKADQVITFPAITTQTYGNKSFDLAATVSSGKAITYTSKNKNIASVSDNKVTIHNAGEVDIEARVQGDNNYNDAEVKTQKLTIRQATLTITARNASREYGERNPEFIYDCTGWKNEDNISNLDPVPVAVSSAGLTTGVGSYDIGFMTTADDKNYIYSVVKGTLKITEAPLKLRANDITVANINNPPYSYTCIGLKNGESAESVMTSQPTFSLTEHLDPNKRNIIISGGNTNRNYKIEERMNGILTISGKPILKVKVAENQMTYGDNNPPAFTLTYTGFETGDSENSLQVKPTVSSGIITNKTNAGTYDVLASGGSDDKYNFEYEAGKFTVHKATLTATVANKEKTYGTPNPSFTFNYLGWKNEDNVNVLTTQPVASCSAGIYSDVGTYDIVVTNTQGSAINYEIVCSNAKGILNVTPSGQKIEGFNPLSEKTYRDNPFDLEPEKATSNLAIQYVSSNTNVATISGRRVTVVGAGTTIITASQSGNNNYLPAPDVTQTLKVNPAPQTIPTFTLPTNITYGSTFNLSAKALVTSTSKEALPVVFSCTPSDIASISVTNDIYTFTILRAPNEGESVTIVASQLGNSNYLPATSVNRLLQVSKASQTISFNTFATRTYGDISEPIIAEASSKLPITFTSTDPEVAVIEGAFVKIVGAGTTYIEATQPGNTNYAAAQKVSRKFEVKEVKLTITAEDKKRQVGKTNPPFTVFYSGFKYNDNASMLTGTLQYDCIANESSNAGTYPIIPKGLTSKNYIIDYQNGTLEVTNKLVLQVSVNSVSREYGTDNPIFRLTYTGFEGTDSPSSLDKAPTVNCAAQIDSKADRPYPITITGGEDDKYAFSYSPGVLTITKAMLTVTANDQSRFFGEENPVLTVKYSGFRLEQNESVLDRKPVAATTATPATPVGTIDISVDGGSDDCYDFKYESGKLTIMPVLSFEELPAITYGDAPFMLPINVNLGIYMSELEITTSPQNIVRIEYDSQQAKWKAEALAAGSVEILAAFKGGQGRMAATATASLNVRKKTLTAKAEDYERKQGESNPNEWKIIYSGFANSDNISMIDQLPVASCIAQPNSSVKNYEIIVSGGLDKNYVFEYQSGTLRVTAAEQLPTAFTPNGDGVNDIFVQGYKVQIFNRLGNLLYEGDNGWDGTYKGRVVEPAVYFYISTSPQGLVQKGTIEVIRTK